MVAAKVRVEEAELRGRLPRGVRRPAEGRRRAPPAPSARAAHRATAPDARKAACATRSAGASALAEGEAFEIVAQQLETEAPPGTGDLGWLHESGSRAGCRRSSPAPRPGTRDAGDRDRLRLQRAQRRRPPAVRAEGLRARCSERAPRAALRRAHAARVPEVHGQAARADLHRAQGRVRGGACRPRAAAASALRRRTRTRAGSDAGRGRGARPTSRSAARARTTCAASTCDIPRDRLVVITGLSGSGKSLARLRHALRRGPAPLRRVALRLRAPVPRPDREARRRVDRRALAGDRDRAEDRLRGTRARPSAPPPRSTTTCACCSRASASPHCPTCGQPIASQSVEQMADARARARRGRARRGAGAGRARPQGRVPQGARGVPRARASCARAIDGALRELADELALAKTKRHDIDVVVDRVAVKRVGARAHRRVDRDRARAWPTGSCASTAATAASRACSPSATPAPTAASRSPSSRRGCSRSTARPAPAPRAAGSAPRSSFDPAQLVPDPDRALGEGAIAPWSGSGRRATTAQLLAGARRAPRRRRSTTPWREAARDGARARSCSGTGRARDRVRDRHARAAQSGASRRFDGVLGELERRLDAPASATREELARYARPAPCRDVRRRAAARRGARACARRRSHPRARARSRSSDARALPRRARCSAPRERAIADRVLREIRERLRFLRDVGLGYLTLDRAAPRSRAARPAHPPRDAGRARA